MQAAPSTLFRPDRAAPGFRDDPRRERFRPGAHCLTRLLQAVPSFPARRAGRAQTGSFLLNTLNRSGPGRNRELGGRARSGSSDRGAWIPARPANWLRIAEATCGLGCNTRSIDAVPSRAISASARENKLKSLRPPAFGAMTARQQPRQAAFARRPRRWLRLHSEQVSIPVLPVSCTSPGTCSVRRFATAAP